MVQTKKRQNFLNVIDSQTTEGKHKQGDTIEFETETIKTRLCDYSDAFILVTGNITVAADDNTDVAFKNCAPFSIVQQKLIMYILTKQIIFTLQCLCTIWLNIAIDTSGSLWKFITDEVTDDSDLSINNPYSFKYKAALIGKTADAVANTDIFVKDAKMVVPWKYFSNFWRSLEMALKNCKVFFELSWIEDLFCLVLETLQNLQ